MKYQKEAASWQRDKARFLSGEWTKEVLIAVTIWRCWNNADIARRPRGTSAYLGADNQQIETWRTIVACRVSDGGLDKFDVEIATITLAWLDERRYHHRPERDTSGGNESVEFWGTTIKPLWPDDHDPDHPDRLPMPAVLKKNKSKATQPPPADTAAS